MVFKPLHGCGMYTIPPLSVCSYVNDTNVVIVPERSNDEQSKSIIEIMYITGRKLNPKLDYDQENIKKGRPSSFVRNKISGSPEISSK